MVGLKPNIINTVVTGVETFQKTLDEGQAGDNIGALLRSVKKKDVSRGMIICKPKTMKNVSKFEVCTARPASRACLVVVVVV